MANRFPRIAGFVGVFMGIVVSGRAAEPTAAGVEFFEKRVRPVLVEHCHSCHSATAKKQRANLLLDSRDGLVKGGDTGPAIVPGEPEKSRLVQAVRYQDPELRMPPRGKLSDTQIADLANWVRMGAPWPDDGVRVARTGESFDMQERKKHWAWQPLRSPRPPAQPSEWGCTPVDAFIIDKLRAAGLAPAPAADRRTLLRRVTYDVTGLPPTPGEIDAFLADESLDAWARVVDRLLASPRYGERWGRHWLDLVRFAETCGHEFDFELPEAHLYRDYVIRAFNDDVRYDQFAVEHVAGDLLPQPRRHPVERFNESILGTGFWFLGEGKHSPVDIRQDAADRMDNQIDVFSKAFLALTVSCARCHDHKFDAITTRDYYALQGYLRSSHFQKAFIDDPEPLRAWIGRIRHAREQAAALALPVAQRGLAKLTARLADYLLAAQGHGERREVGDLDADTADLWVKALRQIDAKRQDHPLHAWLTLGEASLSADQFAARRRELVRRWRTQDDSAAASERACRVFADFDQQGFAGWSVTGEAFGNAPTRSSDLLLAPDARLPVKGLRTPGIARSDLVSRRLQGAIRSPTFTIEQRYLMHRIAGETAQVRVVIDNFQHIRSPIYGDLAFTVDGGEKWKWRVQDLGMWIGHRAYIEILDEGQGYAAIDRILVSEQPTPPGESPNRALLKLLDDEELTSATNLARKYQALFAEIAKQWRSGNLGTQGDCAERVQLLNWLLDGEAKLALASVTDPLPAADAGKLAGLLTQADSLEAAIQPARRAMAIIDGTGENERVYIRGNHKNLGDEVPRRLLEAIAGSTQAPPVSGSGRLDLARRLADGSNALFPRVLVNRLWQHHFGEGLVRSVDNFGVLGELPSHPELLDWLAAEFVRRGWSLKAMHRLMLLSSTYQMASTPVEASAAGPSADVVDPTNRLLHRFPLRRLEAEAIRDALLAISGRLDQRMYGPGVLPHLTASMLGRGRPPSGPLDGDGRRSIYVNVRRNFLTPMFLAFDYPIPFTTIGRRSVSNVPAQALTMMNNPFVVQQAESWARRILAEPGLTVDDRVRRMYVTAFGRPPTASELAEALEFLAVQERDHGRVEDVRAWADLCHVLVNVKEFIFLQ